MGIWKSSPVDRFLAIACIRAARRLTLVALFAFTAAGVARGEPPAGPETGEHVLWSQVLAAHVDDRGQVNYAGIREDPRFQQYLEELAAASPLALAHESTRKAFWINAYNAFAVAGVLSHLPEDAKARAAFNVLKLSSPDAKGDQGEPGQYFFRRLKFLVSGRGYSLDEIEKGILFHRPDWYGKDRDHYRISGIDTPDPRIHFALVCAARGCVKLRKEAYEGARLDEQLNDAVRRFLADRAQARFDRRRRVVELSKIAEWYADDLTDPHHSPRADSVLSFISGFVADGELAHSLSAEEWTIRYLDYDWTLNLQP